MLKKTIVNTFFMAPVPNMPMELQNSYKPILNNRTVLLVTCDQNELNLLGSCLQVRGYYCLSADGSDDALETLRLINASAVIIDTDAITDEASTAAINAIRHRHPSVRVLALSAAPGHQFTSIADAVLMRPFKLQQLYDALVLLLSR